MNERIKTFAEQVGAVQNVLAMGRHDGVLFTETELKRFAELIVRECAKFLDENSGYDNSNNAWHPEPEDLLKHFGVEL